MIQFLLILLIVRHGIGIRNDEEKKRKFLLKNKKINE